MKMDKQAETVKLLSDYFPKNIKKLIEKLPLSVQENICEIRLRAGRPICLTLTGESVFIASSGEICHLLQHGLYTVSSGEVEETFLNMCEHSVYAYSEQIKHGYISLKNGCRAGIAASAVYENGRISGFSSISTINIRIASEHKGAALPIADRLCGGLMIAGPPGVGKTTVLRDAVRLISDGIGTVRRRVAVIDTRGEIAAAKDGVPQADLGMLTDVITGCAKAEGIEMALRTLNPQVIAFDEIGTAAEAEAVLHCLMSGADVLCTAHIGSADEIEKRSVTERLIASGALKTVVFIKALASRPEIFDITDSGVLLKHSSVLPSESYA